jgi:hypothetical protein
MYKDVCAMTSEVKNRGKQKPAGKPAYQEAQFINHSFNEAVKGEFKKWAATTLPLLGDVIDKLLDDGYKLSAKYDSYSDAYACFIQATSPDNRNTGFILTGRSRSGSMAILAAVYRHYVLFEGDWPTDVTRKDGMDDE